MAVVNRPCGDFRCIQKRCMYRTFHHGRALKRTYDCLKTQICTLALSLTLFNSVRLPREAFIHGPVPYLVVYTFWLLAAGLPTTLLQLAMGQLSQQDPVGVWRAVPILRGVGYLKVLSSYFSCVYYLMYTALALAYIIWIAKGSFPLRDCTKLQITPDGYENKMNASECFNSTFLAPFTEYPQYLGIMAVIIFVLWLFVPILLYRLRKTLKMSLVVLTPITVMLGIVLCTFLSDGKLLDNMFESCEQWTPLSQPYIWFSGLVQALLSTQIVGGYMTSAGASIYRHSDVRWTSASVIMISMFAGWLWVLLWESIGGGVQKDNSFISILVLIYQSSVTERRSKEWPLIAFGVVLFSGIITILTLLFPVYDRLHRLTGDHWRFFATALSAVGTALTVAVLARGLEVATILDDLVIPVLAIFTTTLEVVGIVFIYGWSYLAVDIEFLTGVKLPCFWIATWWSTPILLVGVTGWWLRDLLKVTLDQGQTLWPLVGVFLGILIVMVIVAAVAVAKEEQFNLVTKISSAFKPSTLWGPEEPMARYVWMSQRYVNETLSSNGANSEQNNYTNVSNKNINANDDWTKLDPAHRKYNLYARNEIPNKSSKIRNDIATVYTKHTVPKVNPIDEDKFRSPNICIAKGELGGPLNCNCNRHFTLNVPDLRKSEVTTSL
ncbi:hypothetical protein K1T71_008945 [Dendrolimus kikuchii]|uniref:Uncharacterized protein n=1 Tax=Dendrolimus kikuchii TaxID=765133 RepID=A0ACC1CVN6_9NEOP|nr:hypothetical protein K1T71_008945 [Dendrolimus kikuchii]